MAASTDVIDQVHDLVTEVVTELGCDLEEVSLTPAGKRRVLRIAIDTDGGVSLDLVGEATRNISAVLDQTAILGNQPYTLEVTSRGVNAELTQPRHWRRNIGRLVTAQHTDPAGAPAEQVQGRILRLEGQQVTLQTDQAELDLLLSDLTKAYVQVEFNPPAPDKE